MKGGMWMKVFENPLVIIQFNFLGQLQITKGWNKYLYPTWKLHATVNSEVDGEILTDILFGTSRPYYRMIRKITLNKKL